MSLAATSLSLRALFKGAVSAAGLGAVMPVTSGLSPSAQALAVATSAAAAATLVVLPTDVEVEQMVGDARFFYGALQGAGEINLGRAVLPFPHRRSTRIGASHLTLMWRPHGPGRSRRWRRERPGS